jgi:signal transduction histidine kinase
VLSRVRSVLPGPVWDVLLAVAFCSVAVLESVDTAIDDGTRLGAAWVSAVFGVALCAPLAFRRRAPGATYVVMAAVVAGSLPLFDHTLFLYGGLLPLCVATYTLARLRDGRLAQLAWVPTAVVTGLSVHGTGGLARLSDVVFALAFVGAAWVSGRTLRRFDVQGADLRRTLEALADEQVAREEAAVEEERSRIAVEMHDVVAHAVSLMVVQVGATRMEVVDEEERAKLRLAEETGREALVELRRTLGLLRGDDNGALRPLPGTAAITDLVAGMRDAGLDVRCTVDVAHPLPDGLALATYRILQEALTNALKHGGAGAVTATVRAGRGRVVVDVDSPLGIPSVDLPSGGNGLVGMRQRVALYDGCLTAGREQGRFVVHAELRLPVVEAVG